MCMAKDDDEIRYYAQYSGIFVQYNLHFQTLSILYNSVRSFVYLFVCFLFLFVCLFVCFIGTLKQYNFFLNAPFILITRPMSSDNLSIRIRSKHLV